jgi:hypothetical protein
VTRDFFILISNYRYPPIYATSYRIRMYGSITENYFVSAAMFFTGKGYTTVPLPVGINFLNFVMPSPLTVDSKVRFGLVQVCFGPIMPGFGPVRLSFNPIRPDCSGSCSVMYKKA